MLTCYRTSRSLHFPFWAVCSLSGAQPGIWSVGWSPPVHRIAFRLFVAFPFNQRPSSSSPAGGRGGPGLLWPGPLGPCAYGPRCLSPPTWVPPLLRWMGRYTTRFRTVKAIQRATKAMFTAHDDSIIRGPGPLVDRAKPNISHRCKGVVGLSISAALASPLFLTADGTPVRYRRPDLQWDLDHDYLTATLAVPPAGASETYDSECAQGHTSLAWPAGSRCDTGRDPITYACPLPEQRARIDALVAIVAMSDLPWKAYLKGPECAQVTAAWYRELNALLAELSSHSFQARLTGKRGVVPA
jgi:hypothetical protein